MSDPMRTASGRSARLTTRWSHPQTQAAQCLRTGSPNAVVQKGGSAGPAGPQCNGAEYHAILQTDGSFHIAPLMVHSGCCYKAPLYWAVIWKSSLLKTHLLQTLQVPRGNLSSQSTGLVFTFLLGRPFAASEGAGEVKVPLASASAPCAGTRRERGNLHRFRLTPVFHPFLLAVSEFLLLLPCPPVGSVPPL